MAPVTHPTQENNMRKALFKLMKDESGATAIEYGLIAALISVAIVVALGTVGNDLNSVFGTVANKLNNAVTPPAP
jgi:pilus assembly protein Flp/PilA